MERRAYEQNDESAGNSDSDLSDPRTAGNAGLAFSDSLTSQNAIFKTGGRGQHKKYLPYVFTEHGVAMLSGVLRSQRAIDVNIAIMRAFVKLRHALTQNRELSHRVEKIEGKVEMHDTDIRLLVQDIQGLKKAPARLPDKETRIRGFVKEE